MSKQYYEEEMVRFSSWREEYQAGIEGYLEREKGKAEDARKQFISPEKYKNNPQLYRKQLMKLLGFPLTPRREMPKLYKKEWVAEDKNVNIYRIQLQFFDSIKFYGLFFEQKENKNAAPFVIAQHGGGDTAELISSFYDDSGCYKHLVRRMTDRGANVFAPQLLLWRDEPYGATYDRLTVDGKLRQLGGSITALELYMLRGSIDYFLERENLNAEKVGVAGLSYGGMYTLHLAAIDLRIKVCYSSSWVNDIYIHSRPDWSYYNAQNKFTAAETAAMIAPRALVIAMGDKDQLFDYKITQEEAKLILPYYEIYGQNDQLYTIVFDGLHEVDSGDEEIDWMFKKFE